MAFKKGQSGNPGGRPKAAHDLQALAREKTVAALKTLVNVMNGKKTPAAARVAAACALLDRGYGKPVQMNQHTGKEGGPIEVSEVSLNERARRIAFALNTAKRAEH